MRVGEYVTLIVRLARAGVDDFDGVVERVGTGEKARFHGVDALAPTIRRMLGIEIPDGGAGAGDDPLGGKPAGEGHEPRT